MKDDKSKRPIIIVKKKSGHGAHHGGSWKVAYADFVTAMMAFFMVMWILGMEPTTKDMIQGYFNNPSGITKTPSGGSNPIATGTSAANLPLRQLAMMTRAHQRERFEEVRAHLHEELARREELRSISGQVEIIITNDGLRIELIERGAGETLFAFGSSEPRPTTRALLLVIGEALRAVPNELIIEGHTDAVPYGSSRYSNWELSVDRANAARRVLVEGGTEKERVHEVRGYADRQLRLKSDPTHPANRRVTILLPYADASTGILGDDAPRATAALLSDTITALARGASHTP